MRPYLVYIVIGILLLTIIFILYKIWQKNKNTVGSFLNYSNKCRTQLKEDVKKREEINKELQNLSYSLENIEPDPDSDWAKQDSDKDKLLEEIRKVEEEKKDIEEQIKKNKSEIRETETELQWLSDTHKYNKPWNSVLRFSLFAGIITLCGILIILFFQRTSSTKEIVTKVQFDSAIQNLINKQTILLNEIVYRGPISHVDSGKSETSKLLSELLYKLSEQNIRLQQKIDSNTSEINKAINDILKKGKSKVSVNYFGLMGVFSLIFIIVGLIVYFITKSWKKTLATATIFASASFLPISKLLDVAAENKFSFSPTSETYYINNSGSNSNTSIDTLSVFSDSLNIGPFVSGQDTLETGVKNEMLNKLNEWVNKNKYKDLHIVGGVDIRPPKRDAKMKYGDNLTLSQARANWVKEKIISFNPNIDKNRVFAYPGGASKYHTTYDSQKHTANRFVTVFAKY